MVAAELLLHVHQGGEEGTDAEEEAVGIHQKSELGLRFRRYLCSVRGRQAKMESRGRRMNIYSEVFNQNFC